MRIKEDTLHAKSIEPYYTQERSGQKPNTLRLVDEDTARRILNWVKCADHDMYVKVHLANGEYEASFKRTVTFVELLDIPDVKLPANHMLMMICWRP